MARVYRFFTRNLFAENLEQNPGRPFHLTENLEPEIFFQLTKVLRVRNSDEIILLPLNDNILYDSDASADSKAHGGYKPHNEFRYSVFDVQKKELVLNLKQIVENKNELNFELGLILCLPNKPDKLEFILQKAVELGTSKIVLVESDFSQMKHHLRLERLQKILIEAAEQSERASVPTIELAGKLSQFLAEKSGADLKKIFVAMERLNDQKSDEEYKRSTVEPVQILIGPEGGFSESEKDLFEKIGLHKFSLGKRILRMETAAILALGLASLFKRPPRL